MSYRIAKRDGVIRNMVKRTKKPRKVGTSKKGKSNTYKPPIANPQTYRDSEMFKVWTEFAEKLAKDLGNAKVKASELAADRVKAKTENNDKLSREARNVVQAPYDKPESILKRDVYRFALNNLTDQNSRRMEAMLERYAFGTRALRVKFSENPFHWMFLALRSEFIELKPFEINRYSSQLIYARRHKIDPDMLIGFLYQSGNPDQIRKWAKDPDRKEAWFEDRHGSSANVVQSTD